MVLDGFAAQEDAGILTQKLFKELAEAGQSGVWQEGTVSGGRLHLNPQLLRFGAKEERSEVAQALFDRYLAVEQKFSPLFKRKLTADQIYAEFIAENKDRVSTTPTRAERAMNDDSAREKQAV